MEPDLVTIGDNVSVEGFLQTHLFEDRVMHLGTVTIQDYCSIGREACVLYGSEMRANSHLGDLSLIMNDETFVENNSYHGLPAENISSQSE
jgi:carbonic anhydrase/acetyltransferase-like protein (isoleucine patch superfamily)